jgi:hypothetical protein
LINQIDNVDTIDPKVVLDSIFKKNNFVCLDCNSLAPPVKVKSKKKELNKKFQNV